MIKLPHLDVNQKRTLSEDQIKSMTPMDLYAATYECQFIDDPDWICLTTAHLMRILYRLIDDNKLDYETLNLDVKKAEMGTAFFKKYFEEQEK